MCRAADGNLIVHQLQVLERWKEIFIEMFTLAETDQISDILDDSAGGNDLYTEPPTYNEVCTIINRLRINKAAGLHNITPELIKFGGQTLKQRIFKLILKIWQDEEIPSQWGDGIIAPIHKKGDQGFWESWTQRDTITHALPVTLPAVT
jgi:hypothetical protein